MAEPGSSDGDYRDKIETHGVINRPPRLNSQEEDNNEIDSKRESFNF